MDLIGKEFKFAVDNNYVYKTTLGGVMTLTLICSALVSIWYFGQDLYLRKSPYEKVQKSDLGRYPLLKVDKSNFFYAIQVVDGNSVPIEDKSYFTYDFVYYVYIRNETTGKMNRILKQNNEMEKCSSKHINNATLYDRKLYNYYCFSLNNLTVGGDYDDSDYFYLVKYSINRCSKAYEVKYNITCRSSKEVTEKYRDNMHITSYIQKPIVDLTEYFNPVHYNIEYRYDTYDVDSIKETRIKYSNSTIRTDDVWLFSDQYKIISFNSFESVESSSYQSALDKTQNSYKCYISFTRFTWIYDRRYVKIPEIAAVVGGLMNIMLEIMGFLYRGFINNHFNVYMYNRIFNLNENDEDEKYNIKINEELTNIRTPNSVKIKTKHYDIDSIELSHINDNSSSPAIKSHQNINNNNNNNNDLNGSELITSNKSLLKSKNGKDKKDLEPLHLNNNKFLRKPILDKDKIIQLSKDIKNAIAYKKQKKKPVSLTFEDGCCFKLCYCANKSNKKFQLV